MHDAAGIKVIDWLLHTPIAQAPVLVTLLPPLVALFAVIVAWATALWVARQKATIDLIEKRESTDYYRASHATFSRLRRSTGFAHLNDPADEAAADERRQVTDYLNHYELIALGIRRGMLSGSFYRSWMGGPFVRDWNAAVGWIERERWKFDAERDGWRYDPNIYRHFERTARKWSREATRPLGRKGPVPTRAGGAGDEPLPDLSGIDDSQAPPETG